MSSLNERMTLITLWSNSINCVFFFLESKTISCMQVFYASVFFFNSVNINDFSVLFHLRFSLLQK